VMDQQETKHFVKSVDVPYSHKKPFQTVGGLFKQESNKDLTRFFSPLFHFYKRSWETRYADFDDLDQ
jgi:hypothetical protein